MDSDIGGHNRRILVIDDNRSIHEDFQKILGAGCAEACELRASEAALFGDAAETAADPLDATPEFQIDSAFQGQEGAALVLRALEAKRPYAMAFVDARMPPGWDGIETIAKIWEHDPAVQIVMCTAYADYSWQEIRRKLPHPERLVILKKPFDNIEVLQLADALTEKWRLAREDQRRAQDLDRQISERSRTGAAAQSEGSTDAAMQRRSMLAHELGQALRRDELSIHYQPLVDIASRRIVSLEALLRWRHPQLGPISPGEFIPIAEESGLIIPLGEFVLRGACEQLASWERQRVPVVPVAVNLSAVQLEKQDMWTCVRDILRETRLQPQQLALELTESAFMKNVQRHARTLHALRRDGVRIQIDDFGTGYSSLSCLKLLPIDTVKIDRSFISQLDTSSTDEAIVGAILAMARSLGLRAVAEGVETPGQLEVLGRHGCEVAQGFYFSRPLPAQECCGLLLELTERSSFTDTLRLKVVQNAVGAPRLTVVADQRTRTGSAK